MRQYSICTTADFTGQHIYVGIDVHLKRWKIAIETEAMSFKRMDAGWPEKHQLRLRWFTMLERGEDF